MLSASHSYTDILCHWPYCELCNKSNAMGATCGSGTAYPFRAPEFTPGF